MSLLYKPDWEETKSRFLAWWAGEIIDRCAIAVSAPREGVAVEPPLTLPEDPVKRWTDLDLIARLNERNFRHTYYGGEAFPIWHGGYPEHTNIAAYVGAKLTLTHETCWFDPILTENDWDVRRLKIDKNGFWWQFTLRLARAAAEASRGKAVPAMIALFGNGDALASLRGTESLLVDLYDCPERVEDAEEYLMDLWIEIYKELDAILRQAGEGSTTWFELWSPDKFYGIQNDFSCMISSQMFRDIFMPMLERWTRFLDHCVYHVDGVAAFAHVPMLCELPRLQALQILPGAGKPSPLHYLDTLKYVQRAGKNLHISIAPEEVETALSLLSARGLFIQTSCNTEAEAKRLLEQAKRWSKDRK